MNQQSTKNSFTAASTITLEDVKTSIMATGTIVPAKKRELVSAINSFALWVHRPPIEIPADYIYVDRAFEEQNFGKLGVSRARFRNVHSLVKQALRTVGVLASTRTKATVSPEWAALRDRIDGPYAKDCLGRFFRFCTAHGIAPEQVDDGVVGSFLETLTHEKITPKPEVSVQSAVRLWNRQVGKVEGWPKVRLTPLVRRETYSLKLEQLRPDLAADIKLYFSIMSGEDLTHPLTPRHPLRPRSVAKRRYEILQLLSGIHHGGVDISGMCRLADLCEVDLVRKGLTFHVERHRQRLGKDADPRASTMIGGIADAIRIVAKHYVHAPEPVVHELTAIANRFSRGSGRMTEKNRARLAQLESPLVLGKFLSHALIEMGKLARKPQITRMDAIRYSILMAIEILIVAPMRIENIAELDLDVHFVLPPRGKGEALLVVARRSVKNRVDLEYKIPLGSMPAFWTYLKRFRPKLVTGSSTALFPGRKGKTKRSDSLSRQIKDLIRKELGINWTPHVYRHLAARLYIRAHPGDYEGARRLLAHLSAETTYRFYEGEEKANKRVQFGYGLNYMIDIENAVIVDVEATPARTYDEVAATKTMIERTEERLDLKPGRLAADTAYGTGNFLGWLVGTGITPHIPVWEGPGPDDGTFTRHDFVFDASSDTLTCPAGKRLQRHRYPGNFSRVTKANTRNYRASTFDCRPCPLKSKCCPNVSVRKVTRHVNEDARDYARSLKDTPEFEKSRDERKKVEMRFAHLKTHHRFERMRLRGLSGARDEFHLAAIVQNLKTLANRIWRPPLNKPAECGA